MKEKLKIIVVPFILISIGFLMIYSSFYWFVFIRLKLVDLNDDIFVLYVPISISIVLIWFFFRKRLQLLDTTTKHREFTLLVSWVLLVTPVITFLFYLDRQTAEITHLKNADEILNNRPTMYYSIDNSFQHKNKTGMYVTEAPVGRGNEIGVGCYFVCPLTNTNDNIYKSDIWIGIMFGDQFSNRVLDDKERQAKQISTFIDSSITRYNNYNFKTTFLKRLSKSGERDSYLKAIKQTNISFDNENLIILREETGDYKSRAGTSLWWAIFTLITSNVVWILLTIFIRLKRKAQKS
jgi:hypothetical protein